MAIDREKYRQTCRHFNGTVNKRCDAGVDYRALAGEGEGCFLRLPCNGWLTKSAKEKGIEQRTCDKRELYTEAEMDAEDAALEASNERYRKAGPVLAAIRAANKGRSASGTVPCPACDGKGTLHWRISGYNGHMHGKCTTAGCLSWME